jgi:fucose 4-O-acetylase-like acetyltransferase
MAFVVEENLSKRINSLRFLLIVFVVIIHNGISAKGFTEKNIEAVIPAYVENVQRPIGIITAVAVPLFFLFSAYLLYISEQQYIPVLKKKCRTILLPYFLWNLLLVLFYFLMQSLPYINRFFNSSLEHMIKNYGIIDWIDIFVGKFTERREFKYPFVYHFWFLRDLIILNIFFLGIKKLADKFSLGTLVLLLIFWINNINIYVISPEALLFFSLCYYIKKYNFGIKNIDQIKTIDLSVIYGMTVILEYFYISSMPVLHKVNIIISCMFFL